MLAICICLEHGAESVTLGMVVAEAYGNLLGHVSVRVVTSSDDLKYHIHSYVPLSIAGQCQSRNLVLAKDTWMTVLQLEWLSRTVIARNVIGVR